MRYIVCGLNGFSSMKSVYDKLQTTGVTLLRRKSGVWYLYDGANIRRVTFSEAFNSGDTVIRWGNTIPLRFNGATIINVASGIGAASDKALSRRILSQNNVAVPPTWMFDEEFGDYPYIARPCKHHGGKDFHLISNKKEERELLLSVGSLIRGWYFQSVFSKTNEYRVHVAHGKVLAINEKPIIEGDMRANQAITGASWETVIPWTDYNKDMCLLACNAVKALGLDTGAVDVMFDGTRYVVCEVNTAPTVSDSEYTSGRYAKYFDWVFRSPTKPEWWDFTKWERGRSFAWKNAQLRGDVEE